MHEHMDTRTAYFVHFSIDLGMYPWQTFHNSSTSVGEEKRDGLLRDRDKIFFLGEGSEGGQEAIRSNCSVVLHSWAPFYPVCRLVTGAWCGQGAQSNILGQWSV